MRFRKRWGADTREYDLSDAVEAALDGDSYDSGQLEAVVSTASNTMRAFGHLVEMLYENGALTRANVIELASYAYEPIDE